MRNIIAKRLKALFQDAHIIFTIRNQIKALESFYGNHGRLLSDVPKPFYGRHVSLDNWLSYAFQNRERTYIGLINYHETITMYEKIFGRNRVHVFLFEEFVRDKKEFSNDLSKLLTIDEEKTHTLISEKIKNSRDTGRLIAYNRLREKILPGISIRNKVPFGSVFHKWLSSSLEKGKRAEVRIPEGWVKDLNGYYKGGNLRLVEERGLPLEKYEYPL